MSKLTPDDIAMLLYIIERGFDLTICVLLGVLIYYARKAVRLLKNRR